KALARRGSTVHYGTRITGPHHSTGLNLAHGRIVHRCRRTSSVSAGVLGDPNRNPERLGRRGSSWNDQRGRQHRRFFGPVRVRLPENANRVVLVRAGGDRGDRIGGGDADPAHGGSRAHHSAVPRSGTS